MTKGSAYEEPILVSKEGIKVVFNIGTYQGNCFHSLGNILEQLKSHFPKSTEVSVKVYEGDIFNGLVEITFTNR